MNTDGAAAHYRQARPLSKAYSSALDAVINARPQPFTLSRGEAVQRMGICRCAHPDALAEGAP